MLASEALQKALTLPGVNRVLDVGCGTGVHSEKFVDSSKNVVSIDSGAVSYDKSNHYSYGLVPYTSAHDIEKFDLVWASHVLEHTRNQGLFIDCLVEDTKDGGYICITVPPRKDAIVGGHVSLWNPGLLIYNLVLAGVNCRDVMVKQYGYNISVIAKKTMFGIDEIKLRNGQGDLETLGEYLPDFFHHGVDGNFHEHNWT